MLAQGSTRIPQLNNFLFISLPVQGHTITICDTYMCKQSFPTPVWHWEQTGVSPLEPHSGVAGLLFDAACVHLGPQTSWCHSGSDLERGILPGEGVKRKIQADTS